MLDDGELTDTEWAQRRLTTRTYVYRTFSYPFPVSSDFGQPSRYIYKVFEDNQQTEVRLEGEEYHVCETPGGRVQVKLLVSREVGRVKEVWIQRVPAEGSSGEIKNVLNLKNEDARALITLVRQLSQIPLTGTESVRIDDETLNTLLANPESLSSLYERDPSAFREMIANDNSARDVIALSRRRGQVEKFRALLNDDQYFDDEVERNPGGAEAVWQRFLQENSWILGASLSTQLLTSWNHDKLEQVVSGSSIASTGKRVDALLRTSGAVRSLVFAEFKTHRTDLLGKEFYRTGCWAPGEHVAGGVAQIQGTVHRAVSDIGDYLGDTAKDGSVIPGSYTYLLRPRSYLIVGRLTQLTGEAGGVHHDKVRSFELYRRSLSEPEIVTYDELLARAEWFLSAAAESDH